MSASATQGDHNKYAAVLAGLTENARPENDRPSKSWVVKMQELKMMDQIARHANDRPSKSRSVKMQDVKMQDLKIQHTKIRT